MNTGTLLPAACTAIVARARRIKWLLNLRLVLKTDHATVLGASREELHAIDRELLLLDHDPEAPMVDRTQDQEFRAMLRARVFCKFYTLRTSIAAGTHFGGRDALLLQTVGQRQRF